MNLELKKTLWEKFSRFLSVLFSYFVRNLTKYWLVREKPVFYQTKKHVPTVICFISFHCTFLSTYVNRTFFFGTSSSLPWSLLWSLGRCCFISLAFKYSFTTSLRFKEIFNPQSSGFSYPNHFMRRFTFSLPYSLMISCFKIFSTMNNPLSSSTWHLTAVKSSLHGCHCMKLAW